MHFNMHITLKESLNISHPLDPGVRKTYRSNLSIFESNILTFLTYVLILLKEAMKMITVCQIAVLNFI